MWGRRNSGEIWHEFCVGLRVSLLNMRPVRVFLALGPYRRPFSTTPHVGRVASAGGGASRDARKALERRLVPFNFDLNLFQAIDRLKVQTSPEIKFLSKLVRLSPAYLAGLAKEWASHISGKGSNKNRKSERPDVTAVIHDMTKAGWVAARYIQQNLSH
jgi:hypothetical protein